MTKKVDPTKIPESDSSDEFMFTDDNFEMDFEEIKDDRSPVTKVKDGVIRGAKDRIISGDTLRKLVTESMPSGYGDALKLTDQGVSTLKNLYDKTSKEIKPAVKDAKRVIGRIIPSIEGKIPPKITNKLKEWSVDIESSSYRQLSKEEQRESLIGMQNAEIFKMQLDQDNKRDAKIEAREQLKSGVEQLRHSSQMDVFNSMNVSLNRLASYKQNIESGFQRKLLELQYRQNFLLQDSFDEQRRHGETIENKLEGILKNTGLPEFSKLKNPERIQEVLRNEFANSVVDGVLGKRRELVRNVLENFSKKAKEKVVGTMDKVGSILTGVDTALDQREMMRDMGVDGREMAGDMAGGMIGDNVVTRGAKWLRGKMDGNERVAKFGNKLSYGIENKSQYAKRFADSDWGDNTPIVGGLFRMVKDSIGEELTGGMRNTLDHDNIGNMSDPDIFTRKTNKSITEVIPRFLAKIHQEIRILRTGDTSIPELQYDYSNNKFSDKATLRKNLINDLFSPANREFLNRQGDDLVKSVDGDNSLSDEDRRLLGKTLTDLNIKGELADPAMLSDELTYGHLPPDKAEKFAEMFKKYFQGDSLGSKKVNFSRKFNDLGRYLPDRRLDVQTYSNHGLADIMKEMGIVNPDGKSMDLDKIRYYQMMGFPDTGGSNGPSSPSNSPGGPWESWGPWMPWNPNSGNPSGSPTPPAPPSPPGSPPRGFGPGELFGPPLPPNWPGNNGGQSGGNPNPSGSPTPPQGPNPQSPSDLGLSGLNNSNGNSIIHVDTTPVVDAIDRLIGGLDLNPIEDNTAKIHETLMRIEGRLNSGLLVSSIDLGQLGESSRNWLDTSVIQNAKNFGSFLKKIGGRVSGAVKDTTNTVLGRAGSLLSAGFGLAKSGLKGASDYLTGKYKEISDLYVGAEVTPRLLQWKLEAGHYIDKQTGTVITKLSEIRGDIVDRFAPDVVVLRASEIAQAWSKKPGIAKVLSKLSGAIDGVAGFLNKGVGSIPHAIGTIFRAGNSVFNFITNNVCDVYVKGRDEPALLKIIMKSGGYVSRKTGKVIKTVGDIDGPVLRVDGTDSYVVLTDDDIQKGLIDNNGNPIKSRLEKVIGFGKGAFSFAKKQANRAVGFVTDGVKSGWNRLKGLFESSPGSSYSFASNNSIGFGTPKKTNMLLLQIRDLLNERLPGEPTTFAAENLSGEGMLAGIGHKAKGLYSKAKEKGKALLDSGMSFLSKFKKKDGLAISGMDKLTKLFGEIKNSLVAKAKGVRGDADGDGIRDNSYADLIRRKFKRNNQEAKPGEAADYRGAKSLQQIIAEKAKAMYDKFQEKRQANAANALAAGAQVGSGFVGGQPAPRTPAAPPTTKMGKLAGFGGKALGMLGKTAGIAGAVLAGYGAYQDLKDGDYLGAGLNAALGVGGLAASGVTLAGVTGGLTGAASTAGAIGAGAAGIGGSLLAAGGSLLAGIGSVLASPVVIGGAALAGLAYGGYKAYKYFTRKKLDLYSKIRYAQYGFSPEDEDHLQNVLGLEDQLTPGITYDEGKPKLDEKKIKIKDVMDNFGVDVKDSKKVSKFLSWFNNRFKPVFFTHLAALQSIDNRAKLDNLEKDLKKEGQKKYLNLVKYDDGPFEYLTSPFDDEKKLKMGLSDVMAVYKQSLTEWEKKSKTKDETKLGKVGAVMAAGALTDDKLDRFAKPATSIDKNTDAEIAVGFAKMNELFSDPKNEASGRTVTGSDQSVISNYGNDVDALTAIRFKAYGLTTMEMDKVRSLYALEDYMSESTSNVGNKASWNGTLDGALEKCGGQFGVTGRNHSKASDWLDWFSSRFLPTYLNFATAIFSTTGKSNLKLAIPLVKPTDMTSVAQVIQSTKTYQYGSAITVWDFTTSPWAGYELNNSPESIEANLSAIKEKVKNFKMNEEKGVNSDNKTSQRNKEIAENTKGSGSLQSRTDPSNNKDPGVLSKVGSFFKDVYSSGKDLASSVVTGVGNLFKSDPSPSTASGGTMSSGGKVDTSIQGTGGKIDQIPQPTGNKSWNSVKDTIMAAAKMVGIDHNLMATIAAIESGFNWMVKAPTSSATGLFQFIKSTWDSMLSKYGAKYGIAPGTPPTDARANALMGAEFLKANASAISGAVKGRSLTDTDLYMAHFLGAGGARQFLSADPNALASTLMPKAAAANPTIFYKDKGLSSPRTVSEVYNLMADKIRKRGKEFGIQGGEPMKVDASQKDATGKTGSEIMATGNEKPSTDKPATATASTANDTKSPSGVTNASYKPDQSKSGTTNTAFGNLPVTDTSPVPTNTAATQGSAPKDDLVKQAAAATQSAQSELNRKILEGGSLTDTNDILNRSLKVQSDGVAMLGSIYQLLQKAIADNALAIKKEGMMNASEPSQSKQGNPMPNFNEDKQAAQAPFQMPKTRVNGPVSMSKSAFGSA